MRMTQVLLAAALVGAAATNVIAQDAFDACLVFTQADAEAAMGVAAAGEPVNPKVKRPRVVTTCTYNGFKEGKPVAARAEFKFARNEADAHRAFDDARLQYQTKPLMISGADAFWSAKTGQMNLRKGRTWVTVSVGGTKPSEREMEPAKKIAEALVKKL
ncbi:MAG TPA: hypothetical protein VM073_10585 [Usitatibacter sp.]|nr:hypothetical protein [Usitatibacter sp.]